MKDKKYITVLETSHGNVWQYELIEWFKNIEDAKQFLEDKGHNTTNCQWMETNGEVITYNHSDELLDYGWTRRKEKLDRYDINNNGTREICG